MLGDAFSPYLIGAMADAFKPLINPTQVPLLLDLLHPLLLLLPQSLIPGGVTLRQSSVQDFLTGAGAKITYELTPKEYDLEFRALEYSLFSCCFFQVITTLVNLQPGCQIIRITLDIHSCSGDGFVLLLRGVLVRDL